MVTPLQFMWNFISKAKVKRTGTVIIGLFLLWIQSSVESSSQEPRTKRDTSSLSRGNVGARLLLRNGSQDRCTPRHLRFKEDYAPFCRLSFVPFYDAAHVTRLGSLDGRVHDGCGSLVATGALGMHLERHQLVSLQFDFRY